MGDLPQARITQNRPFYVYGVDFAGPFNIKDGKLRNRAIIKAYLCIFVCFSTRAVHLEVVSDLSTESFLNTLKRFVARRGLCGHIYSDNGTNFVGANNELCRTQNSLSNIVNNGSVTDFFFENNIQWHFIPPHAPHHGGLWEAAVKSAKYHAKRIVGTCVLTLEGFTTVFAQIEAVLNSRPLTPLSNDPNDLTALTPGHFLIGDALTAVPQHNVQDIPINRLSQYKHLQQLAQHFWSRWSSEYLCNLQQRVKWKENQTNQLQIGSMVVLKEDNAPPLSWKLGTVTELHAGADGVVRVVTIKTSTGVVKRSVVKVCLLPIEN